ncbi:TonB-dependent receptor [Aridibaculum aurantiacum]|uniref:TonB-dependent receptor n=1 Tax=Aridibaculum aurantiacum TaxID=2810307 RepID=UPI001A975CD9|nr:TonB-dependent receptor [Aridibaculum aurantiacum]
MKKNFLLFILMLCAFTTYAQHTIRLSVKTSEEKTPLAGATVSISSIKQTAIADSMGIATFSGVAAGTYKVKVSFVGMEENEITIQVPQPDDTIVEVLLEEGEEHEEEEVIVTATRISRTIANIPTRVEVISGEELTEKGNMKPGDIRMLLNESTGIQTQQTSATSFNAGIRIQGLEGRYTQLLRDGYPMYSGFSGGLSILQIAPLDLRQVEVIKGAASTLYGGGAIAGLVNLVSKTPGNERELNFLANGTSAGGLDLSGFYSERYGKAGLTVFASRNSNAPFDPAAIGFTAIPKFERYTINPRLFLYGNKTTADVGVTYITEDRTGGSITYIKNGGNGFFEKNNTDRITTQFGIAHKLNEQFTLQFKNSYSRFNRVINIPAYTFDALQQSSFSELTWNRQGENADWIIGTNVITDNLKEQAQTTDPKRDYSFNTYGIFVQNAWNISEKVVLETGLRGDYVNEFGFELLPRVSAMFRVNPKLTTRIGGGYGYKTPTIFTEEAERRQFQNLLPIDLNNSKNERSIGGNWDINYRTTIGELGVSFNHLFFYTRLNNPLVMVGAPGGKVQFQNSTGYLDTKGTETNLRLTYDHFKLFIGYTFTDANTYFNNQQEWLPLTARHRLNNVLMYEIEDKLKLGLEAYHFSRQRLNDGTFGKSYWIMGFMAEKLWDNFSIFLNFENFTNTRQTRFDTIYTGSVSNPNFRDIYAPVEGFVVNGGVKIRL